MGSEGFRNSKPQESVPPDSASAEIEKLRRKYADARGTTRPNSLDVESVAGGRPSEGGKHEVTPRERAFLNGGIDSVGNSEIVELNAEPISLDKINILVFKTKSESIYILTRQEDGSYLLEKGALKIPISGRRSKTLTVKLGEPFVYGSESHTTPVTSGKVVFL
ncbi:MAG: hypothetical protein WAW13_02860 [Minisyncoccia bacterium]